MFLLGCWQGTVLHIVILNFINCIETWTMRKEDIKRLEAFKMILRRREKINWTDHIINEEVQAMIEEERALICAIRKRQRKWIGHMLRGDSTLRTVVEEKM